MLIGLNGQLGSGKDTVYERAVELVAQYNEEQGYPQVPVQRVSFADKLKDSAAALFGVDRQFFEDFKNDERVQIQIVAYDKKGAPPTGTYQSMSVRTMLQRYGTESHRDIFGDDFWVNQALYNVSHNTSLVFVTDVRFPNEVDGIKKIGGSLWKVVGPNDTDNPTHASEQILPEHLFDVIVMNKVRDDDFASLDATIVRLLKPYLDGVGNYRAVGTR